jgi:hypothetical protein
MSEQLYEQSALPFRVDRELSWINAEEVTKKHLWGKRIGLRLLQDSQSIAGISTTSIDTSEIHKLTDPDLRYALRFKDAADAVGWVRDGAYDSSCHYVSILATNEGLDSRILEASYTGVTENDSDSFMKNLHLATPRHNEDH